MPTPASPLQAAVFTPRWTLFSRPPDTDDLRDPAAEEARAAHAAWAEGDRSGLMLGRFELLRRLGRGGMGEVYEALYRGDRRRYAVKILDRAHRGDPSMVTRFEHEFWALTRCRHSGVVAPHFSGEIDGELFYSMELLRGESLEDVLQRGPLAPARVARIGVQLCEALEVLHDAGVLHRDLKPGNILLLEAADGDQDRVKLVDLGIAKLLPRFYENVEARTPPEERLRTKAGVCLGTPGYMAPEVGLGAPPAVKQDVFSLGVTLFRLATGRLPYPPRVSIETDDEPRWSEELGRPLPTIFELALRRAMCADPAMRTPTVERLSEELEDVAAELDADSVAPAHDEPTARLAAGAQGRGRTRLARPRSILWITLGAPARARDRCVSAPGKPRPESRLSWSIALARTTLRRSRTLTLSRLRSQLPDHRCRRRAG
ncbi:MAG: serine/threonine-protein kinase [Nannocystaceae bacterium]